LSPWIPYFFLGIIGGVIVDRVDRKAIMLFCGWTRGLLTLSIPIAHAADVLTLEHIMIVQLCHDLPAGLFLSGHSSEHPVAGC